MKRFHWWQQGDVGWHSDVGGHVLTCLIEQKGGVPVRTDVCGDLVSTAVEFLASVAE